MKKLFTIIFIAIIIFSYGVCIIFADGPTPPAEDNSTYISIEPEPPRIFDNGPTPPAED